MSDLSKKPPANYAPVYAALYPDLAEIARKHGYALAVHGSLARDFDLVAIPWVAKPSAPELVVCEIESEFDIRRVGDTADREHGRLVYSLSIGHGQCALDLSFMPQFEAEINRDELCRQLGQLAADSDAEFTWLHAAMLARKLRAIDSV